MCRIFPEPKPRNLPHKLSQNKYKLFALVSAALNLPLIDRGAHAGIINYFVVTRIWVWIPIMITINILRSNTPQPNI